MVSELLRLSGLFAQGRAIQRPLLAYSLRTVPEDGNRWVLAGAAAGVAAGALWGAPGGVSGISGREVACASATGSGPFACASECGVVARPGCGSPPA